MSPLALTFIIVASSVIGVFALGWWRQLRRKNATSIDLLWTLTLALGAGALLLFGPGHPELRVLVAGCILIWGGRLGSMIVRRLCTHAAEDARYAYFRQQSTGNEARKFAIIYLFQTGLVLFLLLPFYYIAQIEVLSVGFVSVGMLLWGIGIIGGIISDAQLAQWKANPAHADQTCRQGLWSWSRHPNYFFEWLHWCAYAFFVVSGGVTPVAVLIAVAGPALMLFLLLRVTGIPPSERQALQSRGDNYRLYQREVSAFIPWPPRRLDSKEALL